MSHLLQLAVLWLLPYLGPDDRYLPERQHDDELPPIHGEEPSAMTEAEWLTCADLTELLEQLPQPRSARKSQLFGIACCLRFWHLLEMMKGRDFVEATR